MRYYQGLGVGHIYTPFDKSFSPDASEGEGYREKIPEPPILIIDDDGDALMLDQESDNDSGGPASSEEDNSEEDEPDDMFFREPEGEWVPGTNDSDDSSDLEHYEMYGPNSDSEGEEDYED